MAEAMRDIKRRMKTVESTEHITNAMRLVSAAKFRRAKGRYDQVCRQLGNVTAVMERLLGTEAAGGSLTGPLGGGAVIVLITASRGLCGGYNTSLMKLAAEVIREKEKNGQPVCLYTIGSKGQEFFRRQEAEIAGSWMEPPDQVRAENVRTMAETILKECRGGRAREIWLVGMRYINTLRQEAQTRQILPVGRENAEMVPASTVSPDLEFLPDRENVLKWMLPKYLELILYQACMEAAACEHAARRTAMESATDNAHEMMAALSLNYNRARQQAITDELIEIVSGSESLK